MNGIRLMVVRGSSPEVVRESVARLTPDERAEFARMHDPREADVRAVLRAEANRLRAAGHLVSVAHTKNFGVLATTGEPAGVRIQAVSLGDATPVAALGVDCEPWAGESPELELVCGVASAEEFSAWGKIPSAESRAAFVRIWTLKESALKAGGVGLADMTSVRVRPDFSGIAEPGLHSAFIDADAAHAVAVVWRVSS